MKFFSETKLPMALALPVERTSCFCAVSGKGRAALGAAVEHLLGGALATLWDEEETETGR